MKHKYVIHPATCEDPYCPVCEGGLAICAVCGLAEGALTTDCSGSKVSSDDSDRVYAEVLDYIEDAWIEKLGDNWIPRD